MFHLETVVLFLFLWFPHLFWEKLCLPYEAAGRMNDTVCKGSGTWWVAYRRKQIVVYSCEVFLFKMLGVFVCTG